jgi:hypothetical protein
MECFDRWQFVRHKSLGNSNGMFPAGDILRPKITEIGAQAMAEVTIRATEFSRDFSTQNSGTGNSSGILPARKIQKEGIKPFAGCSTGTTNQRATNLILAQGVKTCSLCRERAARPPRCRNASEHGPGGTCSERTGSFGKGLGPFGAPGLPPLQPQPPPAASRLHGPGEAIRPRPGELSGSQQPSTLCLSGRRPADPG